MKTNRTLFWLPRALSILFAAFISLFALDVFGEGYGAGAAMLALLIHLIPTYLIVIALVVAWRREWLGGALFLGLAVLYLIMSGGESWIITAPLLLIGALFVGSWIYRQQTAVLS